MRTTLNDGPSQLSSPPSIRRCGICTRTARSIQGLETEPLRAGSRTKRRRESPLRPLLSISTYSRQSYILQPRIWIERLTQTNKQARRPSKPIHCLFPKQASLRLEKALSSKYSALQQPPNLTRLSTCLPPVRARPSPDPAACRTRRRSHCTLNLRGRSAGARRRAWAGVGTSRADSGSIRGCCIIQHQIDDDEVKSLWMACCNTVAAARVHAHGCTWATTSITLVSLRPPDDEFGSCRLL